uniref:UDENN domain-containing protein n=1 Tax=Capra hircus TaxID=9925 RepID=A0A8C2N977_CAPHI
MEIRRGGDGPPRGPVLHIVVVGFHHKKGCQVEFSYPPLIPGDGHDSHSLPEEWKYLPFLALPDGAHNYQEDTVFFHLPPRNGNGATIYGISCYRQIEAKVRQLKSKPKKYLKTPCTGHLRCRTWGNTYPLYGLLQAKLQLITHAYFEEKDFSQISILKELYEHMNSSLGGTSLEGSQVYLGKSLFLQVRRNALFSSCLALNKLVGALMTVLSLFPGMIEHGLSDSSQYRPRKSMSEDAGLQESNPPADEFVSLPVSDISNTSLGTVKKILGNHGGDAAIKTEEPLFQVEDDSSEQEASDSNQYLKPPSRPSPESSESDWETLDPSVLEDSSLKEREQVGSEQTNSFPKDSLPSDSPPITALPVLGSKFLYPWLFSLTMKDRYICPGYLCLPYMALQQHHLLSDVTIRGFVAGATNILFRQQKHLSDAIVEVEEALIQIHDPELRKLLNPTTADLRFADYLVRHVTENRDDVFLDGTGWEGGDEWIRAQFAVYIHALLAATLQLDNEKILSDYGTTFVTAWKNTHNYRVWNSNKHPALAEINPNSVQNSERGKKLGNVMVTTSRNVVQTGKAVGQSVGGAFSSAKTAMSSWLSTFTSSTPQSLTELPDGKP